MSKPLVDRIPFPKIFTVLAIVLGISLGLCGLTTFVSLGAGNGRSLLMTLGILELGAIVLSLVGLLVTVVAWIVLAPVAGFSRKESDTQRLFDDADNEREEKR